MDGEAMLARVDRERALLRMWAIRGLSDWFKERL